MFSCWIPSNKFFSIKPAIFDLFLAIGIALYVALVYLFIVVSGTLPGTLQTCFLEFYNFTRVFSGPHCEQEKEELN